MKLPGRHLDCASSPQQHQHTHRGTLQARHEGSRSPKDSSVFERNIPPDRPTDSPVVRSASDGRVCSSGQLDSAHNRTRGRSGKIVGSATIMSLLERHSQKRATRPIVAALHQNVEGIPACFPVEIQDVKRWHLLLNLFPAPTYTPKPNGADDCTWMQRQTASESRRGLLFNNLHQQVHFTIQWHYAASVAVSFYAGWLTCICISYNAVGLTKH